MGNWPLVEYSMTFLLKAESKYLFLAFCGDLWMIFPRPWRPWRLHLAMSNSGARCLDLTDGRLRSSGCILRPPVQRLRGRMGAVWMLGFWCRNPKNHAGDMVLGCLSLTLGDGFSHFFWQFPWGQWWTRLGFCVDFAEKMILILFTNDSPLMNQWFLRIHAWLTLCGCHNGAAFIPSGAGECTASRGAGIHHQGGNDWWWLDWYGQYPHSVSSHHQMID